MQKKPYSIRTIRKLRKQIVNLNLARPDYFDSLTDEYCQQNYNGCGPDWLLQAGRSFLSWIYSPFGAAFLIHDIMGAKNEDKKDTIKNNTAFKKWNKMLGDNCEKIRLSLNWFDRTMRKREPAHIQWACNVFGWSAWVD